VEGESESEKEYRGIFLKILRFEFFASKCKTPENSIF
jgi:hypothetical protein